jgi:hypothetical protein
MVDHRSTDVFTPLDNLDTIQRGGTAEWRVLYARCRDRGFAEQMARLLWFRDPDLMPSARVWKFLLEDLHPGLHVDLHEHDTGRAV